MSLLNSSPLSESELTHYTCAILPDLEVCLGPLGWVAKQVKDGLVVNLQEADLHQKLPVWVLFYGQEESLNCQTDDTGFLNQIRSCTTALINKNRLKEASLVV